MPELPEVETVRRTLLLQIINKKITSVNVYYENILQDTNLDTFKTVLINQTFKDILRYGKYLIFILDDYSIISHLRMEGKFFLKNKNEKLDKHEHIEFVLDDNISFRYHDTRKFGKMILLNTTSFEEIKKYKSINKLGKEANDESFTPIELFEKLKNKKNPIKSSLLDQEILAGLGNIYVDEVCFISKLHPKTPSNLITLEDCKNILEASRITLKKAINAGGTTIRSYTSSLGVTGLFQLELLVHSKEKEPCPICKTPIKKIFVGGRGTYFCPNCQINKDKHVVGITGSIASGKTTITNYLEEKGYYVIDADVIVKEEKQNKGIMYNKLVERFSDSILDENQNIDDKLLSKLVFNDETLKKEINSIIHPVVLDVIKKKIATSKTQLVFISVPLLFEASFDYLCDEIICVNVDYETQIKRLTNRNNISVDDAKRRIASQMPLDLKCQKSNHIIDNSKDLCYTIRQIDELLDNLNKKLGGF